MGFNRAIKIISSKGKMWRKGCQRYLCFDTDNVLKEVRDCSTTFCLPFLSKEDLDAEDWIVYIC